MSRVGEAQKEGTVLWANGRCFENEDRHLPSQHRHVKMVGVLKVAEE